MVPVNWLIGLMMARYMALPRPKTAARLNNPKIAISTRKVLVVLLAVARALSERWPSSAPIAAWFSLKGSISASMSLAINRLSWLLSRPANSFSNSEKVSLILPRLFLYVFSKRPLSAGLKVLSNSCQSLSNSALMPGRPLMPSSQVLVPRATPLTVPVSFSLRSEVMFPRSAWVSTV